MLKLRLGLFFGLATGVAASQIPEYAQQYRQRLGSAIDELQAIVTAFDADGASLGLSESEAILRLKTNEDARGRGAQMEETTARLRKLAHSNQAMAQSGPIMRLATLASDFDPIIARRAYQSFEPAVPTTTEGFALGGAGFLTGLGLWGLIAGPIPSRRRRGARVAA